MKSREASRSGEGSFEALLGALAQAPEQPIERALSAALEPGSSVGRYRIVERLGKGAMGAVYRARDPVLGRDVAIKVLFTAALDSPVDRFRREVVALASVSHENVVGVHDAGVDGATPYVVLELVEGRTLRERLGAGALDAGEALRLARDVARGLGAAHAVGVIHRDLKPENVVLALDGTARLVDFGLARLASRADAAEHGLTESGTLLGTAHYMSPEQVRGETADHRSDYFALGAVLYEALTGHRAFEASSRADVITAVLRDQPATPGALLSDPLCRRLLGVALRCLEKAPERRFQSADEILHALEDDSPEVALPGEPRHRDGGGGAGALAAVPETRYATASGVHIAYQVVSPAGPPTLLAAAPFISNVEVMWESAADRSWLEALSSFSHFIHYDRRGVGMSDPIAPECTLDERVDDLRSVLDAERVDRAFLLGVSEGAPTSIAFAARYPDRTLGLVLVGSFARLVTGDGYEHGIPREKYSRFIDEWVETWGTPRSLSLPLFVRSRAGDPAFVRWGNRYERQCASPGTVRRLLEMQFSIDARRFLAGVRCPALVLHRRHDPAILVEHGRYVARHIPGARYVELDGIDHAPWHGDSRALIDLIREFVESASRGARAR